MTKNRSQHAAAISIVKDRADKISLKQLTLTYLEAACGGQAPPEVIGTTVASPPVEKTLFLGPILVYQCSRLDIVIRLDYLYKVSNSCSHLFTYI